MLKNKNGRFVIRVGDTTSHGGEVISGADSWLIEGKPVARIGDRVTCPSCNNGVYNIVEGEEMMQVFGQNVAFEGHRTSCGASLISSLSDSGQVANTMISAFQNAVNNPSPINLRNGSLTADASGLYQNHQQRPGIVSTDISDVRTHISPVFRIPQEGDENLYVMINNNDIGHAGFMIGEGEGSMLFDPSGSYSGCFERMCLNGDPYYRGSSDTLDYPFFDWDDYLAYHRLDGPKLNVYLFVIPREQAEIIRNSVRRSLYQGFARCGRSVSDVLRESGGVFSELSEPLMYRTPWALESELKNIMFPGRGGIIPSAY